MSRHRRAINGHLTSVIIRDLATECDEGKNVECDQRNCGYRTRSLILATRCIPGKRSQHRQGYPVSGHPHVEDELCRLKIIEEQ